MTLAAAPVAGLALDTVNKSAADNGHVWGSYHRCCIRCGVTEESYVDMGEKLRCEGYNYRSVTLDESGKVLMSDGNGSIRWVYPSYIYKYA